MDGAGLTLRVGLTGGIGSGKSTVAAMLKDLGAVIVDTDLIARTLTAPGGEAIEAIAAAFGPEALTTGAALDRSRMRDRVFADPTAKQRLEAILHPMIRAETERQAAIAVAAHAPAVVFDVPLLVEAAHWRARVDKVLVVDCRESTQVERVLHRPGWTAAAAQAVIAQQATRAERLAVADAVIVNDGIPLAQLAGEVDAVWQRWVRAPR